MSPHRQFAEKPLRIPNDESFGEKWFGRIYRATQIFIADQFRQMGMEYGPFQFLFCVRRLEGGTQEEIARDLFYDKGVTARAIHRLEELGLVRREASTEDRRCNRVFITPAGEEVLQRVKEAKSRWGKILTHGLSVGEKRQLREMLQKVAANAISFLHPDRDPEDPVVQSSRREITGIKDVSLRGKRCKETS